MSQTQRHRRIPCRDIVGRCRTAGVYPAEVGAVAIQAPPGEVMVLTAAELYDLYVAARDACRDSWYEPVRVIADEARVPSLGRAS